MRHLGSLLLSLVLTAAWYVVLGLGLSQYLVKSDGNPGLTDKLVLAGAFLVAGALYGLTLLLRLSPLGLVISGLLLVILGFWRFFDATGKGPFAYLPTHIGSFPSSLTLPVEIAAFAGVPLLMTVFSPRRWRRYANPQPVASAYPANPPVPVPVNGPGGAYPPPGGYPPPAYGTPAADPYASPVSTPPADPYAAPVSPAGSGPEGTRMLPGQSSYQPSSGGPSYPPSSGGPSYPPPSSAYPPAGGPSYPPSGGAYPPPAGGPAYPPPASTPNPLWPGSPSGSDGDATRPI